MVRIRCCPFCKHVSQHRAKPMAGTDPDTDCALMSGRGHTPSDKTIFMIFRFGDPPRTSALCQIRSLATPAPHYALQIARQLWDWYRGKGAGGPRPWDDAMGRLPAQAWPLGVQGLPHCGFAPWAPNSLCIWPGSTAALQPMGWGGVGWNAAGLGGANGMERRLEFFFMDFIKSESAA